MTNPLKVNLTAALNAYQLALKGTSETPPFVGTLDEWIARQSAYGSAKLGGPVNVETGLQEPPPFVGTFQEWLLSAEGAQMGASESAASALASKNAAEISATGAAASATSALASENTATSAASSSSSSAMAALASKDSATTSASDASASATASATSASEALISKNAAAVSATSAQSSVNLLNTNIEVLTPILSPSQSTIGITPIFTAGQGLSAGSHVIGKCSRTGNLVSVSIGVLTVNGGTAKIHIAKGTGVNGEGPTYHPPIATYTVSAAATGSKTWTAADFGDVTIGKDYSVIIELPSGGITMVRNGAIGGPSMFRNGAVSTTVDQLYQVVVGSYSANFVQGYSDVKLPRANIDAPFEATIAGLVSSDAAQGTRLTNLEATVGGHTTSITANANGVAANSTAITAHGTRLTNLEATVGGHTTTLTSHTTSIGNLSLAVGVLDVDMNAAEQAILAEQAATAVVSARANNPVVTYSVEFGTSSPADWTATGWTHPAGGMLSPAGINDFSQKVWLTNRNTFRDEKRVSRVRFTPQATGVVFGFGTYRQSGSGHAVAIVDDVAHTINFGAYAASWSATAIPAYVASAALGALVAGRSYILEVVKNMRVLTATVYDMLTGLSIGTVSVGSNAGGSSTNPAGYFNGGPMFMNITGQTLFERLAITSEQKNPVAMIVGDSIVEMPDFGQTLAERWADKTRVALRGSAIVGGVASSLGALDLAKIIIHEVPKIRPDWLISYFGTNDQDTNIATFTTAMDAVVAYCSTNNINLAVGIVAPVSGRTFTLINAYLLGLPKWVRKIRFDLALTLNNDGTTIVYGLHPNAAGQELMFQRLKKDVPEIFPFL